jgi:hypothetical protein
MCGTVRGNEKAGSDEPALVYLLISNPENFRP